MHTKAPIENRLPNIHYLLLSNIITNNGKRYPTMHYCHKKYM